MPKSDKLLVLDLDKTLIRTFEPKEEAIRPKRDCDFRIGDLQIYKRPGLGGFLDYCKSNFILGLWSQGSGMYVDDVVEVLFKENDLDFYWCYNECDYLSEDLKSEFPPEIKDDKILKDINKLGANRCIPLSKIIVVDDQPLHYLDRHNLVRIRPLHYLDHPNLVQVKKWDGAETDKELDVVKQFLSCIINSEDVREQIMHYRTYKDFCFKVRSA